MMRLSKTPFVGLVSFFLLTNIIITTLIIKAAPTPKADRPYQEIVESYWQENNPNKKNAILESLYPEISKDFPMLVETHRFYLKNQVENQQEGMQAFSELTLRIFSFHQYVKRKNWQTLTRMSFQTLQHYGSALQRSVAEGAFSAKKVLAFNQEMKSLTRSSRLKAEDKKIILAKIDRLNRDLNRAETYMGKRENLKKIEGELAGSIAALSNYTKGPTALGTIDKLTQLPKNTLQFLLAQYFLASVFFLFSIGLYRSRSEKRYSHLFHRNDQPLAILNKRGQFLEINQSFKDVLPFSKFNYLSKMDWDSFQKLARIDLKTPIKLIKGPLVTACTLTIDEAPYSFSVRITPIKSLKAYQLSLTPESEVETFSEINSIPAFNPPEIKEEVHFSHILEDVVTELSNLFQSQQVELSLNIKGDQHILIGNREETHKAFKTFIRDMIMALAPKSKSKNFTLYLEQTLDGITLRSEMDDVKLATPVLKNNFKVEDSGRVFKRNLNQGIEVLKNSNLGFDVDLNFGNNFDLNNQFTGSNISIEIRQ